MQKVSEGNVVNLDAVRAARAIADEFEQKLGAEIKRAQKAGFKLVYRLDQEEQIGRGTVNVATVRLLPESNRQRTRFHRMGQAAIQGEVRYLEPPDVFDALKEAVDVAFGFAADAGVM